jgi:hypothetical protein
LRIALDIYETMSQITKLNQPSTHPPKQTNKQTKRQEEYIESPKRKMAHHLKETPLRIAADISAKTVGLTRQWESIFRMLKERKSVGQILFFHLDVFQGW